MQNRIWQWRESCTKWGASGMQRWKYKPTCVSVRSRIRNPRVLTGSSRITLFDLQVWLASRKETPPSRREVRLDGAEVRTATFSRQFRTQYGQQIGWCAGLSPPYSTSQSLR